MKNPTGIIIAVTLIVGVALLGVLIVTNRDDAKENTDVVEIAETLEMDVDQFIADYESEEIASLVDDQRADAEERLGGNLVTPSVFINGQLFSRQVEGDVLAEIQRLVDLANEQESESTLPVLVEVFEDYNCGACAQFQNDLFEIENAFTTDELDLQKKHLPFLRESSEKYARAAEAARLQDKFEEYNLELYQLVHNSEYDFYPFE